MTSSFATASPTARGNRAVLAAYPARIRRKHGAELIDTMLEMAGPGGEPTREAKGLLMLDGLRERFRPPVRRPIALVAAIVALLIGGALGAAAGSWLGSFGYAAMPDAALAARVLPAPATGSTGDLYLQGNSGFGDAVDGRAAAESVRQRLAAEGWRTGPLQTGDGTDGVLANVHFSAETDQTILDVYAYPDANGTPYLALNGWPQRPAAYLPLTIAGLLLGLVAGWLTGVALAHRIQAAGRPIVSTVLTAAGVFLVVPSAAGFVASLTSYLTAGTGQPNSGHLPHFYGFAFGPTTEWMHSMDIGAGWILVPSDFAMLPIWGFGLIAIAAIVARPGRTDDKAIAT
ncbi:hypothetical protein [Actinoplanes derwentensis]|uniref:Uncharacterized protein n=1 Tax=Actinoplanes derwentensis TaxID=113562 RepID=A0A1H1YI12_9ACTN|nr:hypothetical protein [Actinoplanes derwentensis]GID81157.1 hypothetical protein Ade03nite_00810 [Actinoplanes derwentensis]SDT21188.1 hypothetical protein SAMN04489716_2866 [Actinoplanes derwentensis]